MFVGLLLNPYSHFWLGPTDSPGRQDGWSRVNETDNEEERCL